MSTRNVIKGKNLYKILFFGVIFTVLAVGSLAMWGVREIRHDAAAVAVESSARGMAGAVTVLVNAVTSANEEMGTNVLSNLKPQGMRAAIAATLKKHPNLSSVMISDEQGLYYMLSRRPNGLLELIPGRGDDKVVRWTLWKDNTNHEAMKPEKSFDRQIVDSTLAEDFTHLVPGKVNWRSTYRFHSAGESWLTASALMRSGTQEFMVSYLFPIDAVVSQLDGAEKGSAEKIFLYWNSGKVLPITGYADKQVQGDRASRALDAADVSDTVIAKAASLLAVDATTRTAPFSYSINKETWWAYILPLSVFGDTIALGVVVSQKAIVSTLTSDTFLLVFGGILVFLAVLVLFVIHKNRARIEVLGLRLKAVTTPEDVLHLIAEGESRSLEFKQTMRFNLKAGKNGKEIEHASMKTVAGFMNSEGGTLLVGVADSGVITGFEEDNLGNDDKALLHFSNLVNQYLGAEFARYVNATIIEVQGKHVLRAYCMPAKAPAILKNGNNEEFYVRSGPASRQLTLSQFYEWLQNH